MQTMSLIDRRREYSSLMEDDEILRIYLMQIYVM